MQLKSLFALVKERAAIALLVISAVPSHISSETFNTFPDINKSNAFKAKVV